jgi:poly(hydroxyalkanoate) depolymerase family esterase
VPLLAGADLLISVPAWGATALSGPIAGWATTDVPSYVSMYEYTPAKPAPYPPVLVVSHYCGGTAEAMYAIASRGGLVAAADRYGFLMVFPQTSEGCWDIHSQQSLTHDGGGDTQAIVEMVYYEVSHRGANANRVYATGQSSGAMLTEALLAVYPDIFKAGAEFSGVPAGGCWTCDGGYVSHTPQQWGAIVLAMHAGYSGFRPRLQLWHGTADTTVDYNNHLEAIKEWTNVLGLSAAPTSTASLTIHDHPWTRQIWRNSCGLPVLDAFSEQGGPHDTDASEDATYVIPFLGLDRPGPFDPEVPQACDDGGLPGDVGQPHERRRACACDAAGASNADGAFACAGVVALYSARGIRRRGTRRNAEPHGSSSFAA